MGARSLGRAKGGLPGGGDGCMREELARRRGARGWPDRDQHYKDEGKQALLPVS